MIGKILAGKYRIDKLLGEGGMGAVYLAENVAIGRPVALKLLHAELARDPDQLRRFRQEARAAAAIGHPGIVDVLDLGQTDDGAEFIVMERLDGETLGQLIDRATRLPVGEAARIVDAVLDALGAAHEKGILHRDLKPDNVFLVARPVRGVKILDFGLSKLRGADDVRLTQSGAIMGTPLYMSPEQARGARDIGPAADLWAIGAILYHALAGAPPFEGDSAGEVLSKVLTEPPKPLESVRPDVPRALASLCDCLLAKRPELRLGSAQAARDMLKAALAGAPVDAGVALDATAPAVGVSRASIPAGEITSLAPPARRRLWPFVLLGAAGIVVAAVALRARTTPVVVTPDAAQLVRPSAPPTDAAPPPPPDAAPPPPGRPPRKRPPHPPKPTDTGILEEDLHKNDPFHKKVP